MCLQKEGATHELFFFPFPNKFWLLSNCPKHGNKDEEKLTEAEQMIKASHHLWSMPALAPPPTQWSAAAAHSEWALMSGTPLWTCRLEMQLQERSTTTSLFTNYVLTENRQRHLLNNFSMILVLWWVEDHLNRQLSLINRGSRQCKFSKIRCAGNALNIDRQQNNLMNV